MTKLEIEKKLEDFITILSENKVLTISEIESNIFTQLANNNNLIIMLGDVEIYRPIFLNNAAIDFLGFENNWIVEEGYFNYLKCIHTDTYKSFLDLYQFYKKDITEYIHVDYKLRHHTNEWRIVNGITKVILRKNGQPKYSLTIANYKNAATKSVSNILGLLTKREREISNYIAEGYTKKQIAQKLEIAEGTIAVHSKKIYKKLKINKLSELVSLMHKHEVT